MNILLFGKTGQVGWELQRALAPLGNLIALDVIADDFYKESDYIRNYDDFIRRVNSIENS